MAEERNSIRFKCPNCDHPIVTAPESYHIGGKLICPGCGVTVEPPQAAKSLVEKAEEAFATIFKGKNGGPG
jgi:endogenous inhibitor of DNA gyrase (YacG/DUF329 family)